MKKLSKDTQMKLVFGAIFVLVIVGYCFFKFSGNSGSSDGSDTTSLASDPTITDKTEKREYEVANKDITQSMFGTSAEAVEDTASNQRSAYPAPAEPQGKRRYRSLRPAGTVMSAIDRQPHVTTIRLIREEPKLPPIPEKKKPKIYFVVVKENDYQYRSPLRGGDRPERKDPKSQVKLFKAKIYGTQKIKTNETVTIRNAEDVVVGNKKIPAGSIFYGTTSINGNRMYVSLNSVVTPVGSFGIDLALYDSDYAKGIFLKETMDVQVEQSGDQVLDSGLGLVSPAAQIAGTIAKESAKQVQRSLARQNKVSVVLEDSYDVMIGVPIRNADDL